MDNKIRIVADKDIPFLKGILEPYAHVSYLKGSAIRREDLINADALLTRTRTKCNKDLLDGTGIKFIASATIGIDHIDSSYCEANGIFWTNAPGCNSGSVMQYLASALISLAIKYNFHLQDKVLGIIGFGNVGSKVYKLAKALGMSILVNDPPLQRQDSIFEFSSIDRIKQEADIITLHVPLNDSGPDKTLQLVNDAFIDELHKNCFLINSSRGMVINEKALNKGLKSGKISGAVLDVWENEPSIDLELLNLVDIATPHIAGYSSDGKANGTAMIVNALSQFFKLDLDEWYPSELPVPMNTYIEVKENELLNNKWQQKLILSTYDIMEDDARLRNDVASFEFQRADYPLRREFSSYELTCKTSNEIIKKTITDLGFTFTLII